MSIGKRNKDHLKEHAGVSAVAGDSFDPPKSDDPLYFWTNHTTDNFAVNLHPLAHGELENPHPYGKNAGFWGGAFTGRPRLIGELAPAIQASVSLLTRLSAKSYIAALRQWWRLFDAYENTKFANGQIPPRIESVADLNELHAVFTLQRGIRRTHYRYFCRVANA